MLITILGTGTSQGVPVVGCRCSVCKSIDPRDKRLRTSAMIQHGNSSLVIDAGPDFRQQMLRANVRQLDAVVITHSHKDHTGGLDDVRAFNWIQKRPMDIYAKESDIESIMAEFPYAFAEEKYPGAPDIKLHTIPEKSFSAGGIELLPIKALHYKMPVLGFRAGSFSYLTDANKIDSEEMEKIRGSKVLVIGALRKQKHISHFSLSEAVEIIRQLKPKQAFITHISHQMGLRRDVEKELPEYVRLAYDGMRIIV